LKLRVRSHFPPTSAKHAILFKTSFECPFGNAQGAWSRRPSDAGHAPVRRGAREEGDAADGGFPDGHQLVQCSNMPVEAVPVQESAPTPATCPKRELLAAKGLAHGVSLLGSARQLLGQGRERHHGRWILAGDGLAQLLE